MVKYNTVINHVLCSDCRSNCHYTSTFEHASTVGTSAQLHGDVWRGWPLPTTLDTASGKQQCASGVGDQRPYPLCWCFTLHRITCMSGDSPARSAAQLELIVAPPQCPSKHRYQLSCCCNMPNGQSHDWSAGALACLDAAAMACAQGASTSLRLTCACSQCCMLLCSPPPQHASSPPPAPAARPGGPPCCSAPRSAGPSPLPPPRPSRGPPPPVTGRGGRGRGGGKSGGGCHGGWTNSRRINT
jgi:hypothetical protein